MNRVLVITGPTAIGKTGIAEIICLKIYGEIISADSRQIYRGFDIGTAKSSNRKIRKWLIDIVEPQETYDAAQYVCDALHAIEDISQRALIPIIVGGTGLYIRALTVGLFPGEFRNYEIRKELERRRESAEDLWLYLEKVDPEAAEKIDHRNHVRIERALEVFLTSGKPISYWWKEATKPPANTRFTKIGLTMDRKTLFNRISHRIDDMLKQNWIEEVRRLIEMGVSIDSPGMTSIGYRSVTAHIQGKLDLEEMKAQIIKDTKQYAKRQMTWFNTEPDLTVLDISGLSQEQAADEIMSIWNKRIHLL